MSRTRLFARPNGKMVCSKCGAEHPWDLYHFRQTRNGSKKPGSVCIECASERNRGYYHQAKADGDPKCSGCSRVVSRPGLCPECSEQRRKNIEARRPVQEVQENSVSAQDKRYRAQPTGLAPYQGEWVRPTEPITLEAWNASCEMHLQYLVTACNTTRVNVWTN